MVATPSGDDERSISAVGVKKPASRAVPLIIIGVMIIAIALAYRHYRYARPIGTGPASPSVSRESFQKPWSEQPVVLLGLGDSITQGLGASPGKSYFDRLVKNRPNEFSDLEGICLSRVLPNLQPMNRSISGTTSIECLDYQLPKLETQDRDTFGVIVMTTGGNDVIHNYGRTPPREGAMFGARLDQIDEWVRNYDQRLDTIIDRMREVFPGGCHLFIGNIYDPTDGDGDIQHAGLPAWADGVRVLQAYNDVIARFAERHPDVTLVDIRSEFLGHGIHCTHFWHRYYRKNSPYYWYWDNLEDPNDQGYDAIRRLFLNEMSRVLPPKLKPDAQREP